MLTPVPEVALAVSAPRLAAIEYPLGRTLGQPGDALGQIAVLRATLHALETIQTPGGVVNLPFEWPINGKDAYGEPPTAPPIAKLIVSRPWQLIHLMRRDVPENQN